jgi:hypothetical protein
VEKIFSNAKDFVKIDGVLFNKFEFKKAYEEKLDDKEQLILSQSKELQEKIRMKIAERKGM